jgi:hypothetical protein
VCYACYTRTMTHEQKMEVATKILDRIDNPSPTWTPFTITGTCVFIAMLILSAIVPTGNVFFFVLGIR